MTFSVNGIKQEKNQKYTVEVLLCTDAILLARKILEENNILILSLKEFPTEKTTFGDIYFTIDFNFQNIEIVTKYTDIQEACNFFTLIGFDISSINSYSKKLSTQEISTIIANGLDNSASKKTEVWKHIKEHEEEERRVYEDVDLESAKKIIVRVFEKIEEATKRSANLISLQESKKLKSLAEDLKKVRMGTNFEKIRETIQEILKRIDSINLVWYASLSASKETIFSWSTVTLLDVDKELEKLENIKILKSLGAHIAIGNKDYSTLGSWAIFWKFFQKDFLSKMSNVWWLAYLAYDLVELVFVMILLVLGIYTIANSLYLFASNQYGFAHSLISIGIRWLLIFIVRYFRINRQKSQWNEAFLDDWSMSKTVVYRNASFGRLVLLLLITVLVHYWLMRLVTTNFAL